MKFIAFILFTALTTTSSYAFPFVKFHCQGEHTDVTLSGFMVRGNYFASGVELTYLGETAKTPETITYDESHYVYNVTLGGKKYELHIDSLFPQEFTLVGLSSLEEFDHGKCFRTGN